MRKAFEAVAEFLARHGGLDEYEAVVKSMQHLGWSLDQDHAARWRALFAALRTEISDATHATNYVFVFERLLQLYVRIPLAMCREVFSSPLALHIIVERFAAAYADYDADVFRAEREIMCHAENIYSTCELLQDKLFRGDETSALSTFLNEFRNLFDDDDPKAVWEALRSRHRLSGVVFRRDFKRVLWSIEEEVFGKTQIEDLLATDPAPSEKRVIIPRRILESKFTGSGDEWHDLADVVSVPGLSSEPPVEDRRESLGGARVQPRMNDVVSETPPELEHEDRVWSARLPIATPGGDSDASSGEGETAMDTVVRQEKPTQRSPGKVRQSKSPSKGYSHGKSPERPRQQQQPRSPARKRGEKRDRPEDAEPAHDDGVEAIEDDDQGREFPVAPKKRRRKFWTDAEVDALIKGVKRYGGSWKTIKNMYSEVLRNRSNVDIKDKYRNLVNSKRIPPIHE